MAYTSDVTYIPGVTATTQSPPTTEALSEYLRLLGCYDLQPWLVTFGRHAWLGVRYKQDVAQDDQSYTQEAIYCLGYLPKSYWHSSRLALTIHGDDRDWFVASYFPPEQPSVARGLMPDTHHTNKCHPFGAMFQLRPWSVTNQQIDQFAEHPYHRRPLVLSVPS